MDNLLLSFIFGAARHSVLIGEMAVLPESGQAILGLAQVFHGGRTIMPEE